MKTPACVRTWMALPWCFTSGREWTYQYLPTGEMIGMGCDAERGEDYDGICWTSSCSYLWMMSWFLFIFPKWVFRWWMVACVLRAFHEITELSGITTRRGVCFGRTSSCSCLEDNELILFFQVWFYFTTMILEYGLWNWHWLLDVSFAEGEECEYYECIWTSSCSWDPRSSPMWWMMDFPVWVFMMNNWFGNEL